MKAKNIIFKIALVSAFILGGKAQHLKANVFIDHRSTVNIAAVAIVEAFIAKRDISSTKITSFLRCLSFVGVAHIINLIRSWGDNPPVNPEICQASIADRIMILAFFISIRELNKHSGWAHKVFRILGINTLPEEITLERLNWIGAAFFVSSPYESLLNIMQNVKIPQGQFGYSN